MSVKKTLFRGERRKSGEIAGFALRIGKYFNIQDCLEKSLKFKFALKSA